MNTVNNEANPKLKSYGAVLEEQTIPARLKYKLLKPMNNQHNHITDAVGEELERYGQK